MPQICDLHTHSIFSDGTNTPEEIIDFAIDIGLSAVALCDHNTIDGLPSFLAAAKQKPIEAIAGAEFSVDYKGTELHLLGLYIPEDKFAVVSALTADFHKRKEESNIALIQSLVNAGYDLDYMSIKNKTANGKMNRAHIAAELTAKGYTASIKEAFRTLLSKTGEHYKEPQRPDIFQIIPFLKDIGAVPVLAHPFLNLTEEELMAFLPSAKDCGLAGIECYYSLNDEAKTEKSFEIANIFDLLPSGGSDFHGNNKPDIQLGFGKGNLNIPYAYAQAIEAAR